MNNNTAINENHITSTVSDSENMEVEQKLSLESKTSSIDRDVLIIAVDSEELLGISLSSSSSTKRSHESNEAGCVSPKRMKFADQSHEISSSMNSTDKMTLESVYEIFDTYSPEQILMVFDDLRVNNQKLLQLACSPFCAFFGKNDCKQQLLVMADMFGQHARDKRKVNFDCFINALVMVGMSYDEALRCMLKRLDFCKKEMAGYVVDKIVDERNEKVEEFTEELRVFNEMDGFNFDALVVNRLMSFCLDGKYNAQLYEAVRRIINKLHHQGTAGCLNKDILTRFTKRTPAIGLRIGLPKKTLHTNLKSR